MTNLRETCRVIEINQILVIGRMPDHDNLPKTWGGMALNKH